MTAIFINLLFVVGGVIAQYQPGDLDKYMEEHPYGGDYGGSNYNYDYSYLLTPTTCNVVCYNTCPMGYVFAKNDRTGCVDPSCICVPNYPTQWNPDPVSSNIGPVYPDQAKPNPGPGHSPNPGPGHGPNPGPDFGPDLGPDFDPNGGIPSPDTYPGYQPGAGGFIRPNPYSGFVQPNPYSGYQPADPHQDNRVNIAAGYGDVSTNSGDLLKQTSSGLMLEGDMIIKPYQVESINALYAPVSQAGTRAIIDSARSYWKDIRRGRNYIIPYTVDGNVDQCLLERTRSNLPTALNDFARNTCIKFVPRTSERDYLHLISRGGCSSYVGKIGGRQEVSLQNGGCSQTGTIVHEILHALGFFHEQSRKDRDQYIRINYGNIQSGAAGNFRKQNNLIDDGVPYDYLSIMHYRLNTFSANGQNTMTPTRFNGNPSSIGNGQGLSKLDIRQINKLYDCDMSGGTPGPTDPPPTPRTTTPWWQTTTRRTRTTRATTTPRTKPPRTTMPTTTTRRTKPTRSTKRPPRTRPGNSCHDQYPSFFCSNYERVGYCKRYEQTMRRACPKTCNLCRGEGVTRPPTRPPTTKPPCFDRIPYCYVYKQRDLCERSMYKRYTEYACRKTCGHCRA